MVDTPAGPRQRVVLVAARRALIENVIAAARGAGLRPEGIDLSAFAMVRALDHGDPAPTLYLSVGGLTNLAISERGNVLFTRVSGSGLEGMAGVLAERRNLPVDEARDFLSRSARGPDPAGRGGGGRHGPRRPQRGRPPHRRRGPRLPGLPPRRQPRRRAVEQAVVTGPVVGVPGVVTALAEELGLPVVAGSVGGVDDAEGARYAIAAGLAIEERAA
jgi:type IV pilus assembly protein PilM